MNLPEFLPTHRAVSAPSLTSPVRIILRLATPLVAAAALLTLTAGSHAFPQTTAAKADSADASAIDPAAMDALNKMGAYLRTLKTFQVISDITTDDVTNDGQVIQSSKKVDLVAVEPNRLRVEITADDEHRFYFYDGKTFTIFGALVNYYGTVPAPPTIHELVDQIDDQYGIEIPLVDLFRWGTDNETIKRIKGAIDVGPTNVDGITCEQYAFHQPQIDWQIWIQLGDFPLPRKLVISTLTDDARPQHSEVLTWNLVPSYNEDAFTFVPPPGAVSIPVAEVQADSTAKAK